MLRTIIIDDEIHSRQVLEKLLRDYCPEVKIEGTADSMESGTRLIRESKPDLVFLDIEMPDGSGFDLLGSLGTVDFEVIFVTGYEKYAIKAFKTAALDYLLKPVDINDLEKAVKKAAEKRKVQQSNRNFDVFVQNWRAGGHEQIALACSEGLIFVRIQDILYCKGDGAYTYFHLKSGERITVSKNLGEFEELLGDHGFFRVHKSSLINLNEMKKYVRGEGGYVVMSNGDSVDVSKRRKDDFLAQLSKV